MANFGAKALDQICRAILTGGERPEDVLWVSSRNEPRCVMSWLEFVSWLRVEGNRDKQWVTRMLHSLELVVVGDGWWVESDEAARSKQALHWISVRWTWRFVRPPAYATPEVGEDQHAAFIELLDKAKVLMENIYAPSTLAYMSTMQYTTGGYYEDTAPSQKPLTRQTLEEVLAAMPSRVGEAPLEGPEEDDWHAQVHAMVNDNGHGEEGDDEWDEEGDDEWDDYTF